MVDLIQTAYGMDAERVYGGPNWLEWTVTTSSPNHRSCVQCGIAQAHAAIFVGGAFSGPPQRQEAHGGVSLERRQELRKSKNRTAPGNRDAVSRWNRRRNRRR